MTRTAVVTGATGFAGRHLLERIGSRPGHDRVFAWARPGGTPRPDDTAPGPSALPADLIWHDVDVLDAAGVDEAVRRTSPDVIYHLAGASHAGASWQQSVAHLRVHVRGTHHVLEAVRRHAAACRVVVVSTGLVYAPSSGALAEDATLGPVSPYALSKLAEEQLALFAARADALNVVVTRPFNHIGPGQAPTFAASGFARQIAEIEAGRAAPEIRVGNLDSYRDLTDVRDVVRAYDLVATLGRTGATYNICSGAAVRTRDVLETLLSMTAARVTLVDDPSRRRPVDIPFLRGNADRLQQDTGWRPEVPLSQTLKDLLDFWRARVHN